ncbi:MAG: nickel ABC transporter ATP-binding protein NikE [Rhizobiales bacterium]|nr:nickel ABC transporter ATP-binding protein NikE [Hyphomicrobiales bacterium]
MTVRRTAHDPLLEVRGLRIEASVDGQVSPILQGVDLHVRRGEVVGIIGESGAGKSTLGLAVMGFTRDGCRVVGGHVSFDGIDILSLGERARRRLRGARMAYVAQSAAAAFNPAFRLITQYAESPVRFGIETRSEAERSAVEYYRKMQLPSPETFGLRYPHQVSGGQLQRAMTAMAMSCKPELIVFDEPTTALDVTTQLEVLRTIRAIVREQGTAALYISHDLAVVAQMADRILVLRHGRPVEEAETRAMLAAPKDDYTRTLWAVRKLRKPASSPPPDSGPPLLSIRSIEAGYGNSKVLHDVSLDLVAGRTVAVVGESGSGKSTLARVMTGLLPPTSGDLLLRGRPLEPSYRRRSRNELRTMQMIYQSADTSLNPKKRVREILERPMKSLLGRTARQRLERVRELLSMIELEPDVFIDRLPGSLSGGQKQRIAIARALASDPEIVICDEITSALDQVVAEGILRLLQRLQNELGITYLFITHDIETVRAVADLVVVMSNGRVVESGPRDTVLESPTHPYTMRLLDSVPQIDADWLDGRLARGIATDHETPAAG